MSIESRRREQDRAERERKAYIPDTDEVAAFKKLAAFMDKNIYRKPLPRGHILRVDGITITAE